MAGTIAPDRVDSPAKLVGRNTKHQVESTHEASGAHESCCGRLWKSRSRPRGSFWSVRPPCPCSHVTSRSVSMADLSISSRRTLLLHYYSSPLLFTLHSTCLPPCLLTIIMSAIPLNPSSDSSRTQVSANQFKIQPQFEDAIRETLLQVQGFHELIITDLPLGWETFLWEFEESLPHTRKTYDPKIRTLRLKIMPTRSHNFVHQWLSNSMGRATLSQFLTPQEYDEIALECGTSKFLSITPLITQANLSHFSL
jgi:hypothetical protein